MPRYTTDLAPRRARTHARNANTNTKHDFPVGGVTKDSPPNLRSLFLFVLSFFLSFLSHLLYYFFLSFVLSVLSFFLLSFFISSFFLSSKRIFKCMFKRFSKICEKTCKNLLFGENVLKTRCF